MAIRIEGLQWSKEPFLSDEHKKNYISQLQELRERNPVVENLLKDYSLYFGTLTHVLLTESDQLSGEISDASDGFATVNDISLIARQEETRPQSIRAYTVPENTKNTAKHGKKGIDARSSFAQKTVIDFDGQLYAEARPKESGAEVILQSDEYISGDEIEQYEVDRLVGILLLADLFGAAAEGLEIEEEVELEDVDKSEKAEL